MRMKRVLLLGDSIRLNYQHVVDRELDGIAEVDHPTDNCRYAKYTYVALRDWIREGSEYDVIHWNNGIWDKYRYYPGTPELTPPEEYARDLVKVYTALRIRCPSARIVFATTTPILPSDDSDPTRVIFNRDIIRANEDAKRVLAPLGIVINDLHALLAAVPERYICEDKLHLNDVGKEVCGMRVAEVIKDLLGIQKK